MIKAVFKRKSGEILSVNLSGHASSCEDGYDMVCSAVSAISLTIANGITEVLKVKPSIETCDGFLNINLGNLHTYEINKCQVLMETMLIGLKSVEFSYGDYIKVIEEEV